MDSFYKGVINKKDDHNTFKTSTISGSLRNEKIILVTSLLTVSESASKLLALAWFPLIECNYELTSIG